MKKTSTTNILAKIFKKTPEKKVKKKTKVSGSKKPKIAQRYPLESIIGKKIPKASI